MGIVLNREQLDLPDDSNLPDPDPPAEEAESAEQPTEKKKDASMWSLYRQAKEMLDQDSEDYDPNRAVELLIRAANMGCGVAKYRLPAAVWEIVCCFKCSGTIPISKPSVSAWIAMKQVRQQAAESQKSCIPKAFKLNFRKLSVEERKWLKKIAEKSDLLKNPKPQRGRR